ncbi:NAD(P)-binding domain-containing protein, partial [Escherichia sp. SP-MK]
MAAIAFIGLGQMGSPMASNLLQQGHQLRVFDVNAEAVRHLVDKGATPAANPAQAAKDAEFIITMLPNGDLVRNVLFGEVTFTGGGTAHHFDGNIEGKIQ